MTGQPLAQQLLAALVSQWRIMLAVLPGLALTMLHSTSLVLPKADFIDALDSDHYRIQWITGAYLVGSATGMALTRFLGERLGLRWTYLLAIALFAAGSGLSASAVEVIWMTPPRLLQGFGNGLLISTGMVLIWRAFPVQKELAMALYGMAVYVPALAGAPLGGWLTTWGSWRWIFWLNLPLGCLIAVFAARLLPADRPALPQPGKFDWFGLGLLLSWIIPLNVVLDLGQYWGWLNSPFFVPWFSALVLGLTAFTAWGVFSARPLIDLRPLGVRHFALGLGIKVLFSINLYLLIGLLSGYMINLRGYQWWQGSLVLLPAVVTMLIGLVLGTGFGTDANRKARLLLGLMLMAAATWGVSRLDVYTARGWQALHLAMWGVGAGLTCGPALLTTFEGLSTEQTLRTAGIFNVMRSLPTFAALGLLTTLLVQRTDTNFDWLRLKIRPERPVVAESLRQPAAYFLDHGSGRGQAGKQAHAMMGRWVHANSRAYALQDVLGMLAGVPAVGCVLVLFVRIKHQPPG